MGPDKDLRAQGHQPLAPGPQMSWVMFAHQLRRCGSFCSTDPHVADFRPLATSRPLTGLPRDSTTALQPGRAHHSRSEEATTGKWPRKGPPGASSRSARARSQETRAPCPTLTHSHFTIFGCLDFSKISGARVLVRCDSGARARAWGLAAPPPAVRGHEARQRLGHCCTGSGQRTHRCPGAGEAMWLWRMPWACHQNEPAVYLSG